MKVLHSCRSLRDDALCNFFFMGEMPERQFFDSVCDRVDFLCSAGYTKAYGSWTRRDRSGAVCFSVDVKSKRICIPLISRKDNTTLEVLKERFDKNEHRAYEYILNALTIIKELDYIISRVKSDKNRVKYHYIEFKPIAPDIFAKPRLREGKTGNCAYELNLYGTIGKNLRSKVSTDVVVYPLFERFASKDGFIYTEPSSRGLGTDARYAEGYLPCICVRPKGESNPYYEITLEGPFEGEVLATTKIASKVDGIVREQINKALLGLGNERLRDVLTEKKWYRCIRRRYTNDEFVKDLQKKRAEYAAKFLDVWEMGNAFGLELTDHEVRYRVWEVCNSIINK